MLRSVKTKIASLKIKLLNSFGKIQVKLVAESKFYQNKRTLLVIVTGTHTGKPSHPKTDRWNASLLHFAGQPEGGDSQQL